ncbi:hypothetical protein [Microbacterium sp.]|uniref:hypothetical protein n=1 Tax=Microbacterium sp. TaxID=51671 RepID=UPI0039E52729
MTEHLSVDRIVLRATNTHLYRGARLAGSVDRDELAARPRALRIVFSDATEVDAELLHNDSGDLAIDVPAHRTAAGTEIGAQCWRIDAAAAPDGCEVRATRKLG